jgi:hypothetical protein
VSAGERLLKARESVIHSRGGDFSDSLKKRFDDYCTPTGDIPYELNPFYSCVQRAGQCVLHHIYL